MRVSELAKDLKPYIVPWLREASVTVGTGGLSAHALNGPYHTGTLAESQAPWAVTDSEFSAHTSNPDAHHAKQHAVTDGAHHTVAGSALQIVGLTATNTLGLLTPSAAPGAAEAILKSTSAGNLTLPTFVASTSVTTPLIASTGDLTITPGGGDVTVNGRLGINVTPSYQLDIAGSGVAARLTNTSSSQYSSAAFILVNAETSDAYTHWYFFAEKSTAGAATGTSTFQIRRRNAGSTEALTPIVINSGGDIILNAGYSAGSQTYGNVGVRMAPNASYALDVTGAARASTSVTTPLLTTATNVDLVINPAGTGAVQFPNDQTLRTSTFDSSFPITGWQINEVSGVPGYSALTIGKIQADELAVRVFVADEVRVDRGDEFWTKSYGIVATTFTTPASIGGTVSVKFEDSPALVGAIFTNNDWVLIRKLEIDTGLTLFSVWGQVATYVNNSDGTQNWTFTLRSGPTSESITKGSVAIDFGASGAALIHLSVIDAAGAPYIKMRKWAGANPYTPANFTTYVQIGHLGGTGNSYVTPAGYGLYIRATGDESRFLLADDNGLQIRGASLALYNGATQTVNISYTGNDIWVGPSSADKRISWDGSTLNVTGQITVTGGNAAKTDFSNITATIDAVPDGATYKRTTSNEKTGAGRAYSALNGSNVLVTSVIPASAITPSGAGLYLGSNYMGYYSGSAWKTYTDSSGNLVMAGNAAGNYLQWAAASNKLQGVGGGVEQWYADATDGKIKAGAGAVELDVNGVTIIGAGVFRLKQDAATLKGYIYSSNPLDSLLVSSTGVGIKTNGGVTAESISLRANASGGRAVELALEGTNNTSTNRMRLIVYSGSAATSSQLLLSESAFELAIGNTGVTDFSVDASGNVTVTGTVDGVDVAAFKVAYDSHTHDSRYYTESETDSLLAAKLSLSGGTLTGTLTSRTLAPSANDTYDLGNSSNYYNHLYARNIHVDTIVGTPSYAHSHDASDIVSGTLNFARIPTTWTGALTLDADTGGTYNYLRLKTDAAGGKNWDLIAYAQDNATVSARNDIALTWDDGATTYIVWYIDNATRIVDFLNTPTVGGTAVSLSGHTHDDRYFTESESDARFASLTNYNSHVANANAHHNQSHVLATTSGLGADHTVSGLTTGQVLRATGATTAQFMALTSGDITTALGYTPVTNARTVTAGNGLSGGGALSADITISLATPGALTVSTSNSATGAHTHAITSSSSPGAAARLLASDAAGNLTLPTFVASASVTTPLIASTGDLTITPGGGDVIVNGRLGVNVTPSYQLDISGSGAVARLTNTSSSQYSNAAFILVNAEVSDAYTHWYFFAEKSAAGAATGTSTFQIRRRNAGSTEALTPIVINSGGDIILNAGYSAGSQTYGNVGVKMAPNASYALDVTGAARASTSVSAPLFTAASGNVTVSAPATLYLNAATANTVEVQVAGVSQWTASDARLNPRSSVVLDIGDYNRKLRTLYAAEMYVETLVAQDVMATIGGRVMVAPTTTLIADLSSSAPSALYTNLISYWKLDEASGNRADSKGSNTLTDTNTVTSIAGKQSNAAVFTKANSEYLTVADNSSLSVGDIDFYMACWIYPTLDDGTDQYIAAKAGASGNRAWRLWIDWTANQVKFQVYNSSDTATTVTASTFGTISVNTWYFVEAWHDSVGNVIGVGVNTTSNTTAHTTGVKDDTGPFQLGAANGANFYQGYIDEFGFWKYMPASGDRTFLYNSGAGRTYANISDWTTIDVKHNSLTAGTYIYMQAAPGGVAQIEALQVTASGSAVTGGYRYPVIRNLDGTGNNTWVAGDAVVSLGSAVGQGYIDLTSTSTIHSQLGPTITIFARTATTAWNSVKPVVTMGNLRSFVDYAADEYGQAAGNDLTLTPAGGFAGYTIDRTNGLRLFNTDFRLYSGATEAVRINKDVGVRLTTGTGVLNSVSWYNVVGGYDQASLSANLSGGTSTFTLNVNARDPGTGAFSGQAQVIVSNSVTASSVKLLANDGSVGGPNYYLTVAHTGVTINSLALDMTNNNVGNVAALGIAYATPGGVWTTSGWAKSIEFANQGTALVWRKAASGVARGIGVSSNGALYFARSTASDNSAAVTYDMYIDTSGTMISSPAAGAAALSILTPASQTAAAISISAADNGSSYGPFVYIGRNNNASTPATGFLQITNRGNTSYNLWPDNSGNLRIGTTTPTNAQDTSGTVVGTQTSSLDSKIIMGPAPSAAYAIAQVVQAARTALRQFQYKSGAFNHQIFEGIITDYAPRYGMDRDAEHPAGKALNEIQLFSDLLLSVEYLYSRVQQLEAQCARS